MRAPLTCLLAAALALGACGGHDHAGDAHDHDAQEHDLHVHEAPRSGTLIVLAEETAHLELVFESETGTVNLYALGPHAVQPVRLSDPSLTVHLRRGGEAILLELEPVASALTGETVGDTSHYRGTDDRLVGAQEFRGSLLVVSVRGSRYQDVPLLWPPGGN